MSDPYAAEEQWLRDYGLCRCRQNFIRAIYKAWEIEELPETWDEEAERQLPPDLRMSPAPSDPLFGQPILDEDQAALFEEIERFLVSEGLPRTRENWIKALFGGIPEYWDEDREDYVPCDLQLTGDIFETGSDPGPNEEYDRQCERVIAAWRASRGLPGRSAELEEDAASDGQDKAS